MEELTIYDRFLLEAMRVVSMDSEYMKSATNGDIVMRSQALVAQLMAVRQASLEEPGENDITIESQGLTEYASALLMVKPPVAKTPMARHAIRRMRDVLREFKDDMIRNFPPAKPVATATQQPQQHGRSSNDTGAERTAEDDGRCHRFAQEAGG